VRQSNKPQRLFAERLESRFLLAGVTVISHGFQTADVAPDWSITMGQAILDRADGPQTDRMSGSIFQHDPASGAWLALGQDVWTNSNRADEQIVLIYDWAFESDIFEDGWLEAAADNLFANLVGANEGLSGQLNGQSFREVACAGVAPCEESEFHFIGHSRGAILNSLVTERFALNFQDMMIDQVTSLDPHPASFMNDPGYVATNSSADSRLFTYSNVGFADNYYRQDFFYELDGDFDGVFAEGAYNLQIPESVLSGAGSSFEHSDVHTWYYGTITEPFDLGYTGFSGAGRNHDGDVSFPESWYGGANVPPRDQTGFHFSQIGGGDRLSLPISGQGIEPGDLPSVFNGDFLFGNSNGEVTGWRYHGGTFQAGYDNGAMRLEAPDLTIATHNGLYVPAGAEAIAFDFSVVTTSPDGELAVYLGDQTTPLAVLTLSGGGTFSADVAMLAALPGSVGRLRLQLDDLGGAAEVLVDNIRFTTGPSLRGDFDDSGELNCADVDELVAAIAGGLQTAPYDLNDDALVDETDLHRWLELAGAANLPSGQPYLVGDANLDGVVDGLDFILWNENRFSNHAAWCSGDFNADGFIDGLDFVLWNENKFMMSDQRNGRLAGSVSERDQDSDVRPPERDLQPIRWPDQHRRWTNADTFDISARSTIPELPTSASRLVGQRSQLPFHP
jgi:hypothetical protein